MTKIILVVFVCLITPEIIFGQESIEKGHYLLGGGISFTATDDNNDNLISQARYENDYRSFSFSPYAGKFIKDKLLLGIGLNIRTTKIEYIKFYDDYESVYESNSTSYGVSFFLRKFWPISEKIGGFLQPNLEYSYADTDQSQFNIGEMAPEIKNNSYSNDNTISIGSSLGMYYFISKRFSLEARLGNVFVSHTFRETGYSDHFENNETGRNSSSSRFSFNLINSISFHQAFTINYFF